MAIKTAAENKISAAAAECEFPFGCSKRKVDHWIVYRATFLSSLSSSYMFPTIPSSTMIRFMNIETINDFPRSKYAYILWKFGSTYSFVSALEIQSEILRCNQVCRYSKRERGWSVSRFAFDRPRLGEWAANSNTDGNHILRHHRYNFLNDAMESDIWLTGATTIRLDKSMKCSITNPRVRPRSIAYPRRF